MVTETEVILQLSMNLQTLTESQTALALTMKESTTKTNVIHLKYEETELVRPVKSEKTYYTTVELSQSTNVTLFQSMAM